MASWQNWSGTAASTSFHMPQIRTWSVSSTDFHKCVRSIKTTCTHRIAQDCDKAAKCALHRSQLVLTLSVSEAMVTASLLGYRGSPRAPSIVLLCCVDHLPHRPSCGWLILSGPVAQYLSRRAFLHCPSLVPERSNLITLLNSSAPSSWHITTSHLESISLYCKGDSRSLLLHGISFLLYSVLLCSVCLQAYSGVCRPRCGMLLF
jgi:hypothetical protein